MTHRQFHRKAIGVLIVLSILLSAFLTGCTGADGEIYGEQAVRDEVDRICSEPYHLEDKKLIETTPDNMEYTFQTENRDLTFTANSYLTPVYFDATPTGWYTKEISCDYIFAIHEQYEEELDAVAASCETYLPEHGWCYILDYNDISGIVDMVLEADTVWQQELKYNDSTFLRENALTTFHIVWYPSETEAENHEDWVNLTDLAVTGQNNRDDLYEKVADAYAQKVKDGEIPDRGDVPDSKLDERHVSFLPSITLDGKELYYNNDTNPVGNYGLTTEEYKHCWYNEELDTYLIETDIGFVDADMSFPMVNREYVYALGGTYHGSCNNDTYTATWTIDGDTWELVSRYDDSTLKSFGLTKNGTSIPVGIVTTEDDWEVGATFTIGVPVDDFCRFFDLTYTIDEEAGQLRFQSETAQLIF